MKKIAKKVKIDFKRKLCGVNTLPPSPICIDLTNG